MSLEAIELMSERDRQMYADVLAAELQRPPAQESKLPLFERLNGVAMRVVRKQDEHGTMASYDHGGCRCAACRQAGLEHRQAKRRNNPQIVTVAHQAPRLESQPIELPVMRPIIKQSSMAFERRPISNESRLRAAAAEAI
jgi:hypothetical protein